MENLTVQLETRWTLHSGSVGGDHYLFFLLVLVPSHRYCSGRICPGKHLAHSTLMLTAASVLSTFDLLRKVDENGQEIEPTREFTRTALR